MGIRFQCHHCNHPLHVKDYQAGKKGRCPQCKGPFRIPMSDAEYSLDPATVLVGGAGDDTNAQSMESDSQLPTATQETQLETSSHSEALANQDIAGYELDLTQPSLLAEAPNATWYVRPALGGQYGPAPSTVFWQWLLEGRIDVDALVWRDDWAEWQPACNVFADYFARLQAGAPAISPATQVATYSPAMPAVQQAYQAIPGSYPVQPDLGYVSSPAMQPMLTPVPGMTTTIATTTTPSATSTAAPAAVKRQMQKRSRRTKYMIAIGILAFLMISLAIGLAVVLYRQKALS